MSNFDASLLLCWGGENYNRFSVQASVDAAILVAAIGRTNRMEWNLA